MNDAMHITRLLADLGDGRVAAAEELFPLVYRELRSLADGYLRRESSAHTLQPTALVHEAYLRLVDQSQATFRDRGHFLAVAATAMRRILIDHARTRGRCKRGGNLHRSELDDAIARSEPMDVDLIALDEALTRLAAFDPLKARIVELRFFAGLGVDETAVALQTSPRTVKREWAVAKGWLYRELDGGPSA